MKNWTILCSLILAASVIPNAVACEGKKKVKRTTPEPVRQIIREEVTFRPYNRTNVCLRPVAERYCLRPVAERRAYWVPGHYSMRNGCWINSSWGY